MCRLKGDENVAIRGMHKLKHDNEHVAISGIHKPQDKILALIEA